MYGNNDGGYDGPRNFKPVNVGEEIDVNIEAVGEKGDGIAKKDGFVLFIPGVKEGDNVRVRVTKVLRKVGFAEVVGGDSAPAEEPAGEEEAPVAAEEESIAEDSETFGEEEPEAPTAPAEEPAEEVTEEKPAEEPAEEVSEEPVAEEPKEETPEEPAEEEKKEETPEEPAEEEKKEDDSEGDEKKGGIRVL